jgi:hypothetical protein
VASESIVHAKSDVITEYGTTEPFNIHSGVRQGCHLSTILFALGIHNIIQEVEQLQLGYTFHSGKIQILSELFADDLALLTNNIEDMQTSVLKLNDALINTGVRININKTELVCNLAACTLATRNNSNKHIQLNNRTIIVGNHKKAFRYLGIHTNANGDSDPHFKYIVEKATNKINVLSQQNKFTVMEAKTVLNTIIIPTMTYSCDVFKWNTTQLNKLNTIITKGFLKLTKIKRTKMGRGFIFIKEEYGGLGIEEPSTIFKVESITGLHKVLNYNTDSRLRSATEQRIQDVQKQANIYKHLATINELFNTPNKFKSHITEALTNMRTIWITFTNIAQMKKENNKILLSSALLLK